MKSLSAVIITFNEEKNIERCLKSLIPIVDEIVVVDSYSVDGTAEICRKYDVIFKERKWDNYSEQKNYANSLVTSDYILSIDADEEISKELQDSVRNLKSTKNNVDGYEFTRKTNYCGKWILHGGWYPERKLRLWKTGLAKWHGEVHEQLNFTGTATERVKGDLLHYSYPSIDSHANKVNYFTSIAAKDLFDQGKKSSLVVLLISPMIEFWRKFLFQRGFMDGYYGFVIAVMSAYYKFYKYAKLRSLWIASRK